MPIETTNLNGRGGLGINPTQLQTHSYESINLYVVFHSLLFYSLTLLSEMTIQPLRNHRPLKKALPSK